MNLFVYNKLNNTTKKEKAEGYFCKSDLNLLSFQQNPTLILI